jgi:hypothetical protein
MSVADLPIAIDPAQVAAFCRTRGILRLSLFGSILRPDFDPAQSDVDVLVEYYPDQVPGFDFVAHQNDLARLLGRPVDLNTPRCLSRHIRDAVLREALPLYEQA